MKEYPSIPHLDAPSERLAYIFKKYDGSNFRCEFSARKGWYKFGSRHKLVDKNDPIFGPAITYFYQYLANPLQDILLRYEKRLESATAFCEFFGPNSFAGMHESDDIKELRLFDINIYKRGIISPKMFLEMFGHLPEVAEFQGIHTLDSNFIEMIKNKQGCEGVVCKYGEGHRLKMCKLKTYWWLDKLKLHYKEEWEKYA